MHFKNGIELLELCREHDMAIHEIALKNECINSSLEEEEINEKMMDHFNIMELSIRRGLDDKEKNIKGFMIGGEAKKLKKIP